jgi:serine protease SohB
MDILHDALDFAAKGFVVFATAAAIVILLASFRRRRFGGPRLVVSRLNDRYEALANSLRSAILRRKAFRSFLKNRLKLRAADSGQKPNVFVLDFKGDLLATGVRALREEITAIVEVAGIDDEVVIRLESPGGAVPHYGLAAAQLVRLREKKIKLTVCIDRMAASGGYMMACVADQIVAAPFAVIGSIGVVAQVPNLHRLLQKHDIDFEEMTAGEFKRTVTVLGEITEKGRKKFQEQLEDTHLLFKDFVRTQRPKLDVDRIATGEYWPAKRGLELGLVDALATSDEYLVGRAGVTNVYRVKYVAPASLKDRFGRMTGQAADRALVAVLSRLMGLQLQ